MKPVKTESRGGRTVYTLGEWTVSVQRSTRSTRQACGLRSHENFVDWTARRDGEEREGYGGIRDAVRSLTAPRAEQIYSAR
jgi:hypothetical protein